jgi:hypothetical protein
MVEERVWSLQNVTRTVNKGFVQYVTKNRIGATYWDVKKKMFGGTRFRTRGLGISMRKGRAGCKNKEQKLKIGMYMIKCKGKWEVM